MLEGIKTDHICPECGKNLLFDVEPWEETSQILVSIYCEDEFCEYYDWRYIDPISKEIE